MFTRDESMHAPGHSQSKGKIESVAVQELPRLGDGDGDDPRTASVDVRWLHHVIWDMSNPITCLVIYIT